MTGSARTGVIVTAVTVTVSFLTVCVPGAAGAHALAPAVGTSTTSATWAYGAVRTLTATGSAGVYAYQASATVGFAVILNETSTSGGNYALSVHRTMGLMLAVEYCRPACSHPVESASVNYHTWERVNATVNLTPDAAVVSSGGSVPAVGVTASSVSISVGLREVTAVVVAGVVESSRNLSVDLGANWTSAFTPALGLIPLNVSPGEAWSSTSAFTEVGAGAWSLSDLHVAGTVGTTVHRTGNVSLNQSGGVTLGGADPGTTVRLDGTTFDAINLTVAKGPFDLREGFLLIPLESDLFGTSSPSWLSSNANDTASANVSQANVDVTGRLNGAGHLGFDGSGMWWRSAAPNPAAGSVAPAGLVPAVATPGAGSNATYLQGAPESVAQATTDQNCLARGVSCPATAGPRGLLGPLVVLGVVGVAVVLAVAVIAERRRVPPPAYPNAGLYPPGSASAAPPRVRDGTVPPLPPAEDDPLANLW